jgi:hypothetical protein
VSGCELDGLRTMPPARHPPAVASQFVSRTSANRPVLLEDFVDVVVAIAAFVFGAFETFAGFAWPWNVPVSYQSPVNPSKRPPAI